MVTIGETRDQFTVLKGGCGESVEKKKDRGAGGTSFAIENLDAIGFDEVMRGEWDVRCVYHQVLLNMVRRWIECEETPGMKGGGASD